MSILVTPSLFGSVKWYQECPKSWKDDAETQLVEMLTRTGKWDPSFHVQRGIDFEDTVYKVLTTNSSKRGSPHFNNVLELCRGGMFQKKTKKIIKHNGLEYCLYGKLDVWFPTKILDIKTTNDGKSVHAYRDKYLSTMQHHVYCFTEEIETFVYVVALFNSQNKISDVLKIEYKADLKKEEAHIIKQIDHLNDFFSRHDEWFEDWHHKYSLY